MRLSQPNDISDKQSAHAVPTAVEPAAAHFDESLLIPGLQTTAPDAGVAIPAAAMPAPAIRLARMLGIDRAIAFTVLARGWSSLAAAITVALILRYMTPVEQGYYSVINPLVNVQIVFELGFSFVILQTASHECAYLHLGRDGSITGPEREFGRLSSILQKALRWYSCAAVVLLAVLLSGGGLFFRQVSSHSPQAVHWRGPWILAAIAASFTFQVDPVFSFLEGCGFVAYVARARLTQFMTGSLLAIAALLTKHGLYAPGAMLLGQALAGSYAIYGQRRLLGNVLRHKPGVHRTSFRTDIWPLQWRMAVSWVSGYLTVPLFAPMLAHMGSWGPVEAGRMGVSLSIAAKIGDIAMAWMNTKAAPFGRMVALRNFIELDRRFFRALLQSTGLGVLGATVVWTAALILARHGNHYVARFLSPLGLALMLFGFIANTVVSSMAIYLRAHKKEKFMVNSILGAVYTLPAAYFLGHRYGGLGIAFSYAAGSLVIGLGYGTYTFLKWRRIWHKPGAEIA